METALMFLSLIYEINTKNQKNTTPAFNVIEILYLNLSISSGQ